MQLIDVDTWKHWYNEAKINLEVYNQYADGYEDAIDNVDDWMDAQPTIDAVPVVRCGDCIHRVYKDMGEDIGAIGGCALFGCAMSCNGFCSYGERKEK